MKQLICAVAVVVCILFGSCKKESFITTGDARVLLSTDTLHFDTVFTSVGSITQFFKIKNDNNQKLRISSVSLKGGSASAFKINVDGTPGPTVTNIEVDANDSIYVFVSAAVNPNMSNLPFVVQDSIEITYNGNSKFLQLDAWGQNANFLRNRKITGNVTWTNALPYVILGSLQVDTTATLTIQKGCRIYVHADAPLLIDGSLIVQGESAENDRVYFRSDRRDEPYSGYPGSWPGIYFRGRSHDNHLRYATIQNAYQGVVSELPSINANPKVSLEECIIDNIYDAGIFGVQTSINARNCLISNCGKNIVLALGGTYNFTHCTVATVANSYIGHKDPVMFLSNNIRQGDVILTDVLTASFRNCIFWGESGTVEDEVVVSKLGNSAFNVSFTNSLWKVKNVPQGVGLTAMINNQPPVFDSIDTQKRFYSFRLKEGSPAIGKGIATGLTFDLDGRPRSLTIPDIGAYEKQ